MFGVFLLHTARAPRESRAAARATPASGERSSRNPHPQQQARPLARLRAHARCGVRDGEARRLSRRARARRSGRRHTHAASEGAAGGRRGTTSTTTPPACVRACGLACAKSPRLARCTPPRSCSSASRDRADRAAAHLDGAGRREGRSAVTSTAWHLILTCWSTFMTAACLS